MLGQLLWKIMETTFLAVSPSWSSDTECLADWWSSRRWVDSKASQQAEQGKVSAFRKQKDGFREWVFAVAAMARSESVKELAHDLFLMGRGGGGGGVIAFNAVGAGSSFSGGTSWVSGGVLLSGLPEKMGLRQEQKEEDLLLFDGGEELAEATFNGKKKQPR